MPEQRLPRYLDELHERITWERKLARILIAVGEPAPHGRAGKRIGNRSAEGDPARLRGLPVVSRGTSGAIPGSDPLAALLAKERNGKQGISPS